MDYQDAIIIFENSTKKKVVQIERCGVGIANYVFKVCTANEKFILRCSKDKETYKDTIYWLNKLSACEIPISIVLSEGKYGDYSYLILSYIPGDDIGNVYNKLSDSEKKKIAKEVIDIQRKVSRIAIRADAEWTWKCCFVDEMLNRAEERIRRKHYFDINKIDIIKKLQQEVQEYLGKVQPTPYLDDISTNIAKLKAKEGITKEDEMLEVSMKIQTIYLVGNKGVQKALQNYLNVLVTEAKDPQEKLYGKLIQSMKIDLYGKKYLVLPKRFSSLDNISLVVFDLNRGRK